MTDADSHISHVRSSWLSKDKAPAVVVAAQSLVLATVTAIWAIPPLFNPQYPLEWALGASAVIMAVELATLMAIRNIRTVALHTLSQCVRTKVAMLFMVLMALSLAILPFIMKGDGTLAGQIRTFLSYGASLSILMLSLVTVLLSAGLIGADVRLKQIFLTATKPLARWQYVLGRWAGVVMLVGMLAVASMASVYLLAEYLRGRHTEINGEDRRQVETEIFIARAQVSPDKQDVDAEIGKVIERIKRQGNYAAVMDSWMVRTDGDARLAEKLFVDEIRKEVVEQRNSVGPGGGLKWTFSGIRTAGQEVRGVARVVEVDPRQGQMKLSADRAFLRRMVQDTPLRVNDIAASADAIGDDYVIVGFGPDNLERAGGENLRGKAVDLIIDPIIQITYKAMATGNLDSETAASGETVQLLPGLWEVQNPGSGRAHWGQRRDPVGRPNTITVSSRAVSDDGRLVVRFTNMSPTSVRIAAADITVLYPKDAFAANFVRATVLVVMQLMFLAAMGTWASSFLSFPVACLVCFSVLPFSLARAFLTDAVRVDAMPVDLLTHAGHYVNMVMSVVLPDFASTWPSDWLVDGVYIPWSFVALSGALTVAVRALALLALGCLIFRKRELARVQV